MFPIARSATLLLFLFAIVSGTSTAAPPESDQPLDILIPDDVGIVPPEFTLRARVAQITPSEPSDLAWRWGGEGLGGDVYRGTFAENLPVGQWSPTIPLASMMPA